MGKACDHMLMPWYTPVTSQVFKILHIFIALKWQVVVASTVGFYDELNIHSLLYLQLK